MNLADAHPTTQLMHAALGPALTEDDPQGLVPSLLEVAGRPLGEVDDTVRDRDGLPGWARELDPATTSRPAWLGQFVGAVVPAGMSDTDARYLIRDRPAVRRGSPGALRSAAQQYLSGTRRVDLFERDEGNAYRLRVRVYERQLPLTNGAPDLEPVRRALAEAKPAGLTLVVESFPGAVYDERDALFATFDALDASAATFDELDRGTV